MEFKKTVKKILSALMAAAIVATTSVQVGEVSVSAASYSSTKLSAPANFKATATTSTSITLSWSKVSGADGYAIMYYNSSSKKYEDIFADDYIITTNSIKITGLKSNTSYSLKVVALDKKGSKYYYQTYSKPLSVKTKSASSGITSTSKLAAPSGFKCTANTTSSITLKWNAVKGAAAYRLYKYNEYLKSYQKVGDTTETSAKITGLKESKTYTIKIVTLKKSGNKYVEQNYTTANFMTKLGKVNLVGTELDDAVRLLEGCGLTKKNIVIYPSNVIVKNNWTVTAQSVDEKAGKIYLQCEKTGYFGIIDAAIESEADANQLADNINTFAKSVTEILQYFK